MPSTDDQPGYWVLIETGSNQEFILQLTRRRFQVGASGLVKDLSIGWTKRSTRSRGT